MNGQVINKCAPMTLSVLYTWRASLSERSRTWEFNSLQLSCETDGFLLSPPGYAAGQRISTSLSDAHGCFKGCFSLSVCPPSQNGRPLDNISVVAHNDGTFFASSRLTLFQSLL